MNTINCRIKVNDYQDIPGRNVTPTEAVILRTVHDVHAGGCCIKLAAPSGHAFNSEGKPRSNREEVARLRAKYPIRAKSGAPGSHILDDLFPGVDPALPQTFSELPPNFRLVIAQPVSVPADLDAPRPEPEADGEAEPVVAPLKARARSRKPVEVPETANAE